MPRITRDSLTTHYLSAPQIELNFIDEMPHQEHATAMTGEYVLAGRGVRQDGGIETVSMISNGYYHPCLVVAASANVYSLTRIFTIAVDDRVR